MKKLVVITALVFVGKVQAQDLHFSQVLSSPNLLNPGAVGIYDGWERVAVHHRNQWLGGNTKFMSTGFNADLCLNKDMYRPRPYLAVGLQFYNDQGGLSNFGIQQGALTVNGVIPGGNGHQVSVGIQSGIGSRQGSISNLTFDSQWTGSNYDNTLASGETNGLSSFTYFDASAGAFYQFDGDRSTFARNNDVKFQAGFAVYHANAPLMKYRTGSAEKLNRKYVGMITYAMDLPGTKWGFDVQGVQFIQGGHYETIFGGILRRRFAEGSKITGYKQDSWIGFGAYARMKDAIIFNAQVAYKGFRFGLSYDGTVSAYQRAVGAGSLELSMSYVNLHHALFKTRRKHF